MFGTQKKEEIDSLAHTRWNCKYHIVFAPKYRRQAIYGQIRADIGSILRKLCEYKGVEIIEAENYGAVGWWWLVCVCTIWAT